MKKYRKSKRYYYFRKQRWYGIALMAIAAIVPFITNGDITASILIGIPGSYLIFTKDMILRDDYYYEMEAKKFDKWREP